MRHGYAGPVYSSTQRALWPWYVPQLGVRGLACDMPDSTCSNDERINDQRRLVAPSTASLLLNPGVNGPTGEHDLRIVESEEVGLSPCLRPLAQTAHAVFQQAAFLCGTLVW